MKFEEFHPINRRIAIRTTNFPDTDSAPAAYYKPRSQQGGAIIFPHANDRWPGQHEEFVLDPGYVSLPWIRHVDGTAYPFEVIAQEIEIGGQQYDLGDNPRHLYALREVPSEPYIIRSWVNYGQFKGVYHEKRWSNANDVENPRWRGGLTQSRQCLKLEEKWRNPNGQWVIGDEDNYGYELYYAKGLGWCWKIVWPDGREVHMVNAWEY